MQLIEALQSFDLNRNEAKVYVELLGLGLTNVGPVVTKTKLHRQQVYQALSKLEDLNLASSVLKNNRKYFQASSPTEINKLVEKKQSVASQIIPELQKIRAHSEDQLEVRFLYGEKGFCDHLKASVESAASGDGLMQIIGGVDENKFRETVGKFYEEYLELLDEGKVRRRAITPKCRDKTLQEKFLAEKRTELKLYKSALSSPTYTRITSSMTSLEIFSDDIIVVQIYNKKVSQSYREHFEILWEHAESA